MDNQGSDLSSQQNLKLPHAGKRKRRVSKFIFDSPMKPIEEDNSELESPTAFDLGTCMRPVEPLEPDQEDRVVEKKIEDDYPYRNHKISPFMADSDSLPKVPKFQTASSPQEGPVSKFMGGSKVGSYDDDSDSDTESYVSSDDCVSWGEGCSADPYCNVEDDTRSKRSLAQLRRKTIHLTRAPIKPLVKWVNCVPQWVTSDDEDDEEEEDAKPVPIAKNKGRRNTVLVEPFEM